MVQTYSVSIGDPDSAKEAIRGNTVGIVGDVPKLIAARKQGECAFVLKTNGCCSNAIRFLLL